jgi:hypothetical protein
MNFSKKKLASLLLAMIIGLNTYSVYANSLKEYPRSIEDRVTFRSFEECEPSCFLRTSENDNTVSRGQDGFVFCFFQSFTSSTIHSLLPSISQEQFQRESIHHLFITYRKLLL